MLAVQQTINCAGRLVSLAKPQVMGILNITPDSFYAGSRKQGVEEALRSAKEMLAAGATFLDLGAMSSRPGAELLSPSEEQARLLPVVKAIKQAAPDCLISIDTVYADTAYKAAVEGASMINDISGGSIDTDLFACVAALQLPYVLMHMRGQPKDMQQQLDYTDILTEVWDFLADKTAQLQRLGVKDIVLDPGFGFGKSVSQNYILLHNLHAFSSFNKPVLAGLSRKSMIWRPLGIEAADALNGTTALHVIALQQGARILRVHDVRQAMEVIRLMELLAESNDLKN